MSSFEAAMIICFGASWPVAIWKTLKTRHVHGKSLVFLGLVASGYGLGMIHKALHNFHWVIFLYGFNFLMVMTELALCLIYGRSNSNPLFDTSATADTLFDDDEGQGEAGRPTLRLISAHDRPVVDPSQEENLVARQVMFIQNLRRHGW